MFGSYLFANFFSIIFCMGKTPNGIGIHRDRNRMLGTHAL